MKRRHIQTSQGFYGATEAVESFTAARELSASLLLCLHACFVYICKCWFAITSSLHVTWAATAQLEMLFEFGRVEPLRAAHRETS